MNDEQGRKELQQDGREGRIRISRRKLLTSLGLAGAAIAGGGFLNTLRGAGQGDPPSSAHPKLVGKVKSVDQLRNTPGSSDGQQVSLLGYYENSPGNGGGLLYWDASSTAPDNGGTVFAVDGVSEGRWRRPYTTRLNLAWFGWNGLGVDDDAGRVQAAVNALPGGGIIEAGRGLVRIGQTVTVEAVPIVFMGAGGTDNDGFSTQYIIATGSQNGFLLSGVRGGGFSGLQMRGEGLTGGSMIATERRGGTGNYMLSFYNTRFKNGYNGITLRACNTVRFQNCVWSGFNGEQVILLNGVDNSNRADPVEFSQCAISAGNNPHTDNLVIDGLGGSIKFFATAILFGRHGLWLRNRTGENVPKFLYFEGGGFENGHGVPVYLEHGSQVQFANTYISCDGEEDNVRIASTFTGNATFNGCVIRGCGRNGIDIASSRVTVTGSIIGNNGRTAHPVFARTVAAIAGNGSGGIRVTTTTPHGWETDDRILVQDVTGATEANGKWSITVINPTQFDLQGPAYAGAYISGGTAWRCGAGIHIRPGAHRVIVADNVIGSLADGVQRQDYGIVNEAADVMVVHNDLTGNLVGPYLLKGSSTRQTRFSGNKGVEQIDGWLTVSVPGEVDNGLYNLANMLYLDGQQIRVVRVARKLSAGTCSVRLDADGSSAGGGALAATVSLQTVNLATPYTVDGTGTPRKLQLRVLNASSASGLEVQIGYQIIS